MTLFMTILTVVLAWEVGKKTYHLLKSPYHPYEWSCPHCYFKVRSNDNNAIERIKEGHQH